MDRLAAHIIATAVFTAALAAVPAVLSAPAAHSSETATHSSKTATPSKASASSSASSSSTAAATTLASAQSVPCSDAYQVGTTAYARWHGMIAFSVKQFYSPKCHRVYGYAYPWLQFRVRKVHYDVGVADFDVTHDAIDGARTFLGGAGGPDFWSSPVSVPAGTCSEGLTHVFFPDNETDTFTTAWCN